MNENLEASLEEGSLPTKNQSKSSCLRKFWEWKGKKWLVDTLTLIPIMTTLSAVNEVGVHGYDLLKCVKARAYNLPLYPLVGPVMEVRDAYRKYIWRIRDESNPPFWRDKLANFVFSLAMQGIFYVPALIAAGEKEPKKLAGAVATNMAIRLATMNFITFPLMKYARKKFGVTPKPKK